MAGVTLNAHQGSQGGAGGNGFGLFFKPGAAPGSDMTIADWDFGSVGYVRFKLTASMHVYCEAAFLGNIASWDLTPGNGGSIPAGISGGWCYAAYGFPGSGTTSSFHAACWRPAGISDGWQSQPFQPVGSGQSYAFTGRIGMGVSLSSTYLNWPNTAGWELSKLQVNNQDGGVPTPPGSDPSGGQLLWLCRDALGSASTLLDSSGNGRNGTPGPNGLTIVVDGPYA